MVVHLPTLSFGKGFCVEFFNSFYSVNSIFFLTYKYLSISSVKGVINVEKCCSSCSVVFYVCVGLVFAKLSFIS